MSKVFIGIHLVFATKHRYVTLPYNDRRLLYSYVHEFLKTNKCHTLRINGMGDHIHVAFNMHPDIRLSDLIKELKRQTSVWMSNDERFPLFNGWGKGYYAASFSYEVKDKIIDYIKNQEKHHNIEGFLSEMEWFAMKAGLRWHNDDWE